MFIHDKHENELIRNVVVHLSDNPSHDSAMVNVITKDCIQLIIEKFPEVNFRKFYLWSDGCSSQYKGKHNFYYLSKMSMTRVERNYYGSEHGKGESDSATAHLNMKLNQAIFSRKVVIFNANDAYNFLSSIDPKTIYRLIDPNQGSN